MAEPFQLPEEVTGARQRASELAGVAGQYQAGEVSVIDTLKQKITEAYSSNQDIIQKLDQAITGYLPSPAVGREKYQNIFNPFQRESLVSQYVANQATPMLTYSGLLGQRMGRIEDTLGAGVRGYQAESQAKQAKAQQAQQQYQNLMNEFQLTQPTQETVDAGGRRYRVSYDWQGNVVNRVDLGPTPSSGGGAGDLTAALKLLGIGSEMATGQTTNSLDSFWENEITFEDLNDKQKQEALRISATSDKPINDIVKEVYNKQTAKPSYAPGGIVGASGVMNQDNLDYSGLQYTGFKL